MIYPLGANKNSEKFVKSSKIPNFPAWENMNGGKLKHTLGEQKIYKNL